jgi:hypothetical protein
LLPAFAFAFPCLAVFVFIKAFFLQAEESFKGLRRKLPKTKQEFNWQASACNPFAAACCLQTQQPAVFCTLFSYSAPIHLCNAFAEGLVEALAGPRAYRAHAY